MKHLPKHLQPRWRYLAVGLETWPDADLEQRSVQRDVWYAAQNLLGDVGSAELDLRVVWFDGSDGSARAVVRTHRGEVDRARAALACIDTIDDQPVGLRVHGTSGTVRGCRETYLGRGPEISDQRPVVFENAQRRAVVRDDGQVDVRTESAFAGATNLDLQ